MPAKRERGFLIAFGVAVALGLAVVPAINMVVDPFWRFGLVTIPGINAQRPEVSSYARMAKAGAVCRLQPRQAALGTSRVEVGLDPRHPGWGSEPGPVYNLALAGSGLKELRLTFQHLANASRNLRRVVIGLDFLMFNAHREAVVFGTEVIGFDEKRLLLSKDDACWRALSYDSDRLLAFKGLLHVYRTISNQIDLSAPVPMNKIGDVVALYDEDGLRRRFDEAVRTMVAAMGYRALFGESQEFYYAAKVWRPPPENRYCFTRPGEPDTMQVFRQLVDDVRRSGVEVRFYLEPLHARMMLALQDSGLWPQFEDWKRGVVNVLAEEGAQSRAAPFPLWDFSGFNTVTNEHVPAAGDLKAEVRWFWEPSHYKKQTGDLMLDRLLGHHEPGRDVPPDFGVRLTSETVEEAIRAIRRAGRDYRSREPEETALIAGIVDRAMMNAEGANCGLYVEPLREASEAVRRGDKEAAQRAFIRAREIDDDGRRRAAEAGVAYREPAYVAALKAARNGEDFVSKLKDLDRPQGAGHRLQHQG